MKLKLHSTPAHQCLCSPSPGVRMKVEYVEVKQPDDLKRFDDSIAEIYPDIYTIPSPFLNNAPFNRICFFCGKFVNSKLPRHEAEIKPTHRAAFLKRHPRSRKLEESIECDGFEEANADEFDATQYVRRQVELSLASIPSLSCPATICRNGSITMFENGESLKPYQSLDLQRLCTREKGEQACGSLHNTGFILAYDMGLGKTAVAIALVCSRPLSKDPQSVSLATLVACPSVGIMSHWRSEIQKFSPRLRVLVYHGKERNKNSEALEKSDVVLVTYAQISQQHRSFLLASGQDLPVFDRDLFPLFLIKFHRVVLDEAHVIRNPDSKIAAACWALKKHHGLCLTGTPAQNSLRDLYSLLKFLNATYRGMDELEVFDELISVPLKQLRVIKATELLQYVLAAYMIYRPKNPPGGGKPLVDLPQRQDQIIRINLTPQERDVYDYVRNMHPFKSNWAKMIRMRQACDHPFLLSKAIDCTDVKTDDTAENMRACLDNYKCLERLQSVEDLVANDVALRPLPAELQDVRKLFDPTYTSTKISAVLDILDDIACRPREKTIIFSHFITVLSLIGDVLDENQILFTTYTGNMDGPEREQALARISKDDRYTVILMSIMAGGTGLSITSCNNVILMEPWWNPFVEEQAFSRVHRMGQTMPVHTYRLIVNESIEESMVQTQELKRTTIGEVLNLCAVPDASVMQKWLEY